MGTDVIGSRMPAAIAKTRGVKDGGAGYGDMYDETPSSLTPGQAGGKSNFLPQCDYAGAVKANGQTRNVSAAPIKTAPGMSDPNANPVKIGAMGSRASVGGQFKPRNNR